MPNLGTGLRVDDGDIVVQDGRLELVSGVANLAQALELRVTTPLGSDRYDVRYGLDVAAIFTGTGVASEIADVVRLNLVRTLGTEPRVQDIRDIRIEPLDGTGRRAWHADVSIMTADGSAADLTVKVGAPT
jgi:hypothetical protein